MFSVNAIDASKTCVVLLVEFVSIFDQTCLLKKKNLPRRTLR